MDLSNAVINAYKNYHARYVVECWRVNRETRNSYPIFLPYCFYFLLVVLGIKPSPCACILYLNCPQF